MPVGRSPKPLLTPGYRGETLVFAACGFLGCGPIPGTRSFVGQVTRGWRGHWDSTQAYGAGERQIERERLPPCWLTPQVPTGTRCMHRELGVSRAPPWDRTKAGPPPKTPRCLPQSPLCDTAEDPDANPEVASGTLEVGSGPWLHTASPTRGYTGWATCPAPVLGPAQDLSTWHLWKRGAVPFL